MSPGSPPTRVRWWEDEGDRGATTEQATPAPPPPAPPPPAPDARPAGDGRRPALWGAVALVAAVVAVAAGFTVHEATTPDASPRPAPVARDAAAPEREAPDVDAPRDVSGYVRAPCSLLENRQARDLGYTRWSTRAQPDGRRECRFTVDDPLRTLTLSALDGPEGSAFTDLYRDPRPPVFVPLEIGGLPAVRTQAFATSELCRITVGVADGRSLRVDTAVPDDRDDIPITDPCARAERGAGEAVANLPRKR